jgi:UDP-N-acetylglucosamine diphosphorylase / glucose-1-phosphate thymidylyltransferase / UDP-N-acetylgalactosamine diphosphorylase / glucosamine-1-phosphate N-acetyltransferase / galactosamine-1-phosphate N-acetyltransferase
MIRWQDLFGSLEGFPFPELFEEKLAGFDDLSQIWDVLRRIQKGFVAQRVKPQIRGVVEEGAILKGEDIYIGQNSRIMPGAMVIGPTIIGNNVEVRHGAFVRGHVIVGDSAVIGHATEVIRSVLLPEAKAPHFNYVGDSILGRHVNLGAGTKLSNLKNDGSEIKLRVGDSTQSTGLRKFGAILGDSCLLGCNSVTNPGTIMGTDCRVYANATVGGVYESKTIVKLRQNIEVSHIG